MISVCDTGPAELVQYKVHFLDNCLANILTLLFQYVSIIGQGTKNKKATDDVLHSVLMPMTHLPETCASNPVLETRKCDMLSSAGF